jgi:multicomponent Na+:H+ antiporter subunit E
MRLVSLVLLLYGFWLLLSGIFYAWLLVVGALSALLIAHYARRMEIADEEGLPLQLTPAALTYWPWLVREIVKSAVQVTRIVLDPRLPIAPTMIRVKSGPQTPVGITTYANSITLTPGTISVEVSGRNREILVHALTDDFARDLESGVMDRRVRRFEGAP